MEYTIQRELGKGGQGVTFLAESDDGIHYVLKEVDDSEQAQEEVERLTALNQQGGHENVVQVIGTADGSHVYDDDAQDGRTYVVMEFVEGDTLTKTLPLPLEEATWWKWFEPILKGFHHIHTNGVVHRDVKPDNIMMRNVGSNLVPIIIDFGIAKPANPFADGYIGGTPPYCPPESGISKSGDGGQLLPLIGPPSDIYSLAVMSYEVLYNELPTTQDDAADTAEMLHKLHRDGSPFAMALAKALERNPGDRPQSVFDWIIDMATPRIESRPLRELDDDDPFEPTKTSSAGAGMRVAQLRGQIEEEFGLPDGSLVLLKDDGRPAHGTMLLKNLRDQHVPTSVVRPTDTLRFLSEIIGQRYGLKVDRVKFVNPREPSQEHYHGKNLIGNVFPSF